MDAKKKGAKRDIRQIFGANYLLGSSEPKSSELGSSEPKSSELGSSEPKSSEPLGGNLAAFRTMTRLLHRLQALPGNRATLYQLADLTRIELRPLLDLLDSMASEGLIDVAQTGTIGGAEVRITEQGREFIQN